MTVQCNPRNASAAGHTGGSAGFSLIELMVVVAIATILVAVAVPSYLYEVRKGRRTDAKTALLDLAGREERFYNTNNGAYTSTLANLGYSGSFPLTVGSGGYYQITSANFVVTTGTTTVLPTYTITATPTAGTDQAKDTTCASFTVTSAGVQSSLNSSGATSTSSCW